MTKLFKRFKKRYSKLRNRNASYFIQENVIQGNGDLRSILNPLPDVKVQTATRNISINELPLNEISIRKLKVKFGVPSYILKNYDHIEKHKVYFFRDRVGFYKLLMQFHFINNQFFFASTRISVPKGLSVDRKHEIIKQVLIKYTGATERKQVKDLDIKLIDENNNMLFVFDYVSFYLNYLAQNDLKERLIKKYCGVSDEDKENEESRKEIHKYI